MGKSMTWDITSKCNLRCKHCYNSEEYFCEKYSDLSLNESYEVIEFLKNNNYTSISFLGGEPLLREDIYKILAKSNEMKISTIITSNGTMITKEMLAKLNACKLSQLLISVEGYNAELNDGIRGEGSFEKLLISLKNIKEYRQYKECFQITLCHTVNKKNIHDLYRMVDFCKDNNVNYINIFPLMNSGNASENWDELTIEAKEYIENIDKMIGYACKKMPTLSIIIESRPLLSLYYRLKYFLNTQFSIGYAKCQVDDDYLYILSNGEVHPCGLYKMDDGKKAISKGLIFKEENNILSYKNSDDIYNTHEFKLFLESKDKLKKESYTKNCSECKVSVYCTPCPFQFQSGVAECEEIFIELPILLEKIGISKVRLFLEFDNINAMNNDILNLIFERMNLTINEYFEIYKNNVNIDFIDFILAIREFERKFILEVINND